MIIFLFSLCNSEKEINGSETNKKENVRKRNKRISKTRSTINVMAVVEFAIKMCVFEFAFYFLTM